jgi:hypothetical protein
MIDTSKLNSGCIGRKVAVKIVTREPATGAAVGVSTTVYRLADWDEREVCVLDDSVPGGERWIDKESVEPFEPFPKTLPPEPRKKRFWT